MRPTRFDLMLQYTREFITEWFDQNPLGQIGIVGMRAGIGERLGGMSGEQACPCAEKSLLIQCPKVIHKRFSRLSLSGTNLSLPVNRVCRMPLTWRVLV